jgi:hypothetical protein
MTRIDDFTVEVRRDGNFVSSSGRYDTLYAATRAALDLVEDLENASSGTALHVEIRRDSAVVLDIRVIPGGAQNR